MAKDYHQLRRAVSFASFGKLRFKTEYEQDLWSECSRLIANCIIFYNASLLSRLLEHQEKSGDTQGAEAVKKISPIAWQHINKARLKAVRIERRGIFWTKLPHFPTVTSRKAEASDHGCQMPN